MYGQLNGSSFDHGHGFFKLDVFEHSVVKVGLVVVLLCVGIWGFTHLSHNRPRSAEEREKQAEMIAQLDLLPSLEDGTPLYELLPREQWKHRSYGNIDEWTVFAEGVDERSQGESMEIVIEFGFAQPNIETRKLSEKSP